MITWGSPWRGLARTALSALGLGLALALALAGVGAAKPARPATLVADRVEIRAANLLIAEGHVEVFHDGQRLQASAVRYDRATGKLTLIGPIRLSDTEGQVVILADAAELSDDLREGLLSSARIVMNNHLQLAAQDMLRTGGRYTAMRGVVASSCKICSGDPTPLWEIRASRVVHDQQERQIFFDHAQLRLGGVPILYLPRLRIPDPTLKRAQGFLIPSLRTTSNQGLGLRFPYFIPIGQDRDLTLTPYVTTQGVRSVDLRYRQAFRFGTLELIAAAAQENSQGSQRLRGYVEGRGDFRFADGYRLQFKAEGVTDPAYFLDYGLPNRDRLASNGVLSRTERDRYFAARVFAFSSLREGDDNSTLPSLVADVTWQKRFDLRQGGLAGIKMQLHGHYRYGRLTLDGNGDGLADGRDVGRASITGDFRQGWMFGPGMILGVNGQASADLYGVHQDATLSGTQLRLSSAIATELRWPLIRSQGAVTEVIEPTVQLVLSHRDPNARIANEDSRLVEFDEANLFAFNRFSGSDVVEKGLRANLGFTYTRAQGDASALRLAFGRVIASQTTPEFSTASGLSGLRSDWLFAASYDNGRGFSLLNRLLVGDDGKVTKEQLRLKLAARRADLTLNYSSLIADPLEGRLIPASEVSLDLGYRLSPNLRLRVEGRYDAHGHAPTKAGLGLAFANECIQVDLSLSHSYVSSTSVTPTTQFGLSVELLGFGGTGTAGPARSCRG